MMLAHCIARSSNHVQATYLSRAAGTARFVGKSCLRPSSTQQCPACGAAHDRDANAACNLKNSTMSSMASACDGYDGTAPY